MLKKKIPKPVPTLLFFALTGIAFFILWNDLFKFELKKDPNENIKTVQDIGTIYSLEPVVVELAGRYLEIIKNEANSRPRIGTRKKHLTLGLDLELEKGKKPKELIKRLPQIKDTITGLIAIKNMKDIETKEGKAALCNEISSRLNGIFQEKIVKNAFLRVFLIH